MSTCDHCGRFSGWDMGRFSGRDMKHRYANDCECFACCNMCWGGSLECDDAASERREALTFWRGVCVERARMYEQHKPMYERYFYKHEAVKLRRWAREAK